MSVLAPARCFQNNIRPGGDAAQGNLFFVRPLRSPTERLGPIAFLVVIPMLPKGIRSPVIENAINEADHDEFLRVGFRRSAVR